MEDGSVVRWKGVPKSLKGLLGDGSVVTTLKLLKGNWKMAPSSRGEVS